MSLKSRREYAANLILEDVRLRGELTDDQYAPIQAEALGRVDQAALATRGMREAAARQAIDQAVAEVKDELRQRVAKVGQGSLLGGILHRLRFGS